MNKTQEELNTKTSNSMSTKNLVLTGMFTAVICVMSQISIPIQPIPFTLALFAIFITGALLPPRYALMSVLAYILLGAFGLPVYAGLQGGVHVLTGVTGGYLMAYPIMAFITSLFYHSFKKAKVAALVIGMVISLLLCYLIGTLWFTFVTHTGFYAALTLCVFPFVLFDLLKIVLATSLSIILRKSVLKQSYFN